MSSLESWIPLYPLLLLFSWILRGSRKRGEARSLGRKRLSAVSYSKNALGLIETIYEMEKYQYVWELGISAASRELAIEHSEPAFDNVAVNGPYKPPGKFAGRPSSAYCRALFTSTFTSTRRSIAPSFGLTSVAMMRVAP